MNAWEVIEPLYRGSFDKLCRYVSKRSGASRASAEDIVQDAFVKLAERLDTVKDPKAYLDRAVETGIVDWSRGEIPVEPDDEMLMVHPPAVYTFEQAEMRDRIIRFLRGLTEREKEAVALVIFAGYSQAEAGSILGISQQAVADLIKAGVRRAR